MMSTSQYLRLEVPAWSLAFDSFPPGLVWACGVLTVGAGALLFARASALDPRLMYWAFVVAGAGAVVGAHLLARAVDPSGFAPAAWRIWEGPKSSLGAMLGGALAGAAYLRLRGGAVLRYANVAAPALALGYAVFRIGCFLNGDDFGTLTSVPWAVRYSPASMAFDAHISAGLIDGADVWSRPVHPVQLYSSALGLLLFVLLARAPRGGRPDRRAAALAVGYGIGRFVLEFLRGDERVMVGALSLAQAASLLLAAAGLWWWQRSHRRARAALEIRAALPRVASSEPTG